MQLKTLFEKNKNIIINTDIDGFLSGMILQKYYGCKVVGFSNSWDCVWIDPDYEKSTHNALLDAIYIDLFVANPSVVCIEQHIIGYDEAHNRRIAALQTKINPNIMRSNRTFTGDYFHKYPFGTVHFLIALMEKEGINVELPSLESIASPIAAKYNLKVGDILLRADDALFSSLGKYKSNTEEWWPWLLQLSGNASSIKSMISYIANANYDTKKNFQVKDNTGAYFKKEFNCDGADGAFDNIVLPNGEILPSIRMYRDEISQMMQMPLKVPLNYITHKGIASTKHYFGNGDDLDTSKNAELYSYAFIYGPRSPKHNFSFTIRMN